MKTLFLLFLFCASLMHSAESKPNVILIISDDHGFNDYGFMGHPTVKTPHLDCMAAEGLLYTRGYKANRAKLSPYEMGIRTPMFVPGAAKPDRPFSSVPGTTVLYDLKNDPLEKRDLSSEIPGEIERLRALLASSRK